MKKTSGYIQFKAAKENLEAQGVQPSKEPMYTHEDMLCSEQYTGEWVGFFIGIIVGIFIFVLIALIRR